MPTKQLGLPVISRSCNRLNLPEDCLPDVWRSGRSDQLTSSPYGAEPTPTVLSEVDRACSLFVLARATACNPRFEIAESGGQAGSSTQASSRKLQAMAGPSVPCAQLVTYTELYRAGPSCSEKQFTHPRICRLQLTYRSRHSLGFFALLAV